MVDSLPPSGTDLDNETIITNSNDELSVPLDDDFLAVGSSGKVEVIGSTQYYLGNFAQDSGDWTRIDSVSDGIATVKQADFPEEPQQSTSVTADLTNVDKLTFRIDPTDANSVAIRFDGIKEGQIDAADGFQTLEISGLDYGANTTVKIHDTFGNLDETFRIDYVRGNPIQPESRKIELVDTGGL